jgi:multidrug efflux system membrane fusion protein
LIFLAGLILAGCGPADQPVVQLPPPPVSVSQALAREVVNQDSFEGQIKATETVAVRARVQGHLIKVNFQDGQMVKKDDLLFEIDPRTYQASLEAAEAQVAATDAAVGLARSEYNRTRELVAKRAANREELEVWAAKESASKAEKLKAEASVAQAKLDLGFTKIAAPISGKISRPEVTVGNLVNGGGTATLLTTIVTVDPVYVYFDVDERSVLRYRAEGNKDRPEGEPERPLKDLKVPVLVGLEGEQGYPHKGVIDFMDNRVNPGTGTFQVRGVLSNASRIFEDGLRARVRVPVSDPYKTILVSERAIGSVQGRPFVYVLNDKDVVERRDVTLDRVFDGLQVIRTGLKAGEWVVVNGTQRVRDGLKVAPRRVPMPDAPEETNEKKAQ